MVVPRKGKDVKTTKTPFFTAVVSSSHQLRKLKLPKKLVRNHGKHLPNFAYICVPNRKAWPIELVKSRGKVWLRRGWDHFAKHYSIACGCALVFRYDLRNHFRVLIVDTTALQNKSGESAKEPAGKPSKVMCDAQRRVQQMAKALQSESDSSFIVEIPKINLSYNYYPVIPVRHCEAYFKKDDYDVILRVKKKNWRVKCCFEKYHKFSVSLTVGWREFVLKNHLTEGDNCVFQLIIGSLPKTYNVHVFRVSDHMAKKKLMDEEIKDGIPTEKSGRRGKDKEHFTRKKFSETMAEAKAFLGDKVGFILPLSKSHIESSRLVHVPVRHSKKYLKDDGDDLNAIFIHGEDKRTWKVKYCISGLYQKLSDGWIKV